MAAPHLRFHHFAVSVPRLEEAIAWYRDILGFELERRFHLPRLGAETAFLVNGDNRIELFEVEGAAEMSAERRDPLCDPHTLGNKHCAFVVEDLDAFHDEAVRKGADVAIVTRLATVGFNAVYLRDCAGNLVELVELQ